MRHLKIYEKFTGDDSYLNKLTRKGEDPYDFSSRFKEEDEVEEPEEDLPNTFTTSYEEDPTDVLQKRKGVESFLDTHKIDAKYQRGEIQRWSDEDENAYLKKAGLSKYYSLRSRRPDWQGIPPKKKK